MLYRLCQSLLRFIFAVIFPLKASGLHHIPATGPVLLCSNHISNIDPTTVGVRVKRKVNYMAKSELFSFPPMAAFLRALGAFPVKRGGVSKEAIKSAIGLLKEGEVLGIFPEGSRSQGDTAGKKGAAMLALRGNATVIPVAIIGKYRLFRSIRIVYGAPIDLKALQTEGPSDVLDAATAKIMAEIRSLTAAG
ncbi:1-acyl-sn-glycerol-3-phosphate acyltransferase [Paenibacillaceae bacterium]|nr:1-acyl-sn-glycerol-3-phosphate acyltransferase [Paenibacillaceae bacterium]